MAGQQTTREPIMKAQPVEVIDTDQSEQQLTAFELATPERIGQTGTN